MKIIFTGIFITLLLSGCGQQNIKQDNTAAYVSEASKITTPLLLAKNDQSGTMSDADLDALLNEEDEVIEVSDPIEPFNRAIFWVNDKLYVFLFNPLAKGWRYIAPKPIRVSVSDFYYNIRAPIRIVSAALQGRGKDAYDETGRFLINSTIGILGFHDVGADHYGMQRRPRGSLNIGAAFGHWGIGPGMYLVLPFVGPSNVRDGIGLVADFNLYPPTYMVNADRVYSTNSVLVWSIDAVNAISLDKGTYDAIREQSLDPYLVVRDAYTQNRASIIEENR